MQLIWLASAAALASASPLQELEERHQCPTSFCAVRGFERHSARPYWASSQSNYASDTACGLRCAADSKCRSYAYGFWTCRHYQSDVRDIVKTSNHGVLKFSDKCCSAPPQQPPPGRDQICGKAGYDKERPRAFRLEKRAEYTGCKACQTLCSRTPGCRSFAVGKRTCLLYAAPVKSNFDVVIGSPYSFYDVSCVVAPTPGYTSTSRSTSVTQPLRSTASSTTVRTSASSPRSTSASSINSVRSGTHITSASSSGRLSISTRSSYVDVSSVTSAARSSCHTSIALSPSVVRSSTPGLSATSFATSVTSLLPQSSSSETKPISGGSSWTSGFPTRSDTRSAARSESSASDFPFDTATTSIVVSASSTTNAAGPASSGPATHASQMTTAAPSSSVDSTSSSTDVEHSGTTSAQFAFFLGSSESEPTTTLEDHAVTISTSAVTTTSAVADEKTTSFSSEVSSDISSFSTETSASETAVPSSTDLASKTPTATWSSLSSSISVADIDVHSSTTSMSLSWDPSSSESSMSTSSSPSDVGEVSTTQLSEILTTTSYILPEPTSDLGEISTTLEIESSATAISILPDPTSSTVSQEEPVFSHTSTEGTPIRSETTAGEITGTMPSSTATTTATASSDSTSSQTSSESPTSSNAATSLIASASPLPAPFGTFDDGLYTGWVLPASPGWPPKTYTMTSPGYSDSAFAAMVMFGCCPTTFTVSTITYPSLVLQAGIQYRVSVAVKSTHLRGEFYLVSKAGRYIYIGRDAYGPNKLLTIGSWTYGTGTFLARENEVLTIEFQSLTRANITFDSLIVEGVSDIIYTAASPARGPNLLVNADFNSVSGPLPWAPFAGPGSTLDLAPTGGQDGSPAYRATCQKNRPEYCLSSFEVYGLQLAQGGIYKAGIDIKIPSQMHAVYGCTLLVMAYDTNSFRRLTVLKRTFMMADAARWFRVEEVFNNLDFYGPSMRVQWSLSCYTSTTVAEDAVTLFDNVSLELVSEPEVPPS